MYNYCLSGIQKKSCNKPHLLESKRDKIDTNNINGYDSNYIETFEVATVKEPKSDDTEVKKILDSIPKPKPKNITSDEPPVVSSSAGQPPSLFGIPLGKIRKNTVEMPPKPKLGFFYAEIKDNKIDNLLNWIMLGNSKRIFLNLKPNFQNIDKKEIDNYLQSDIISALKKYKTFLDEYGTINIKINKENCIKFIKQYPELFPYFDEDLINVMVAKKVISEISRLDSLFLNIMGFFIINFDLPKINKPADKLANGPEEILPSNKEFENIKFIQILIPKIFFIKEKNLEFLNFIVKEFMPKIGEFNEKQSKASSEEFDSSSELFIKFLDFIGKNILNDNVKLTNFINYLFLKTKNILDFSVKLKKESDNEKKMKLGLDFAIDLIAEFINFIPSDKCYFTEESNIITLEPNTCDSLQKSNQEKALKSCPPIPEQKVCPEPKVCPVQKECPSIPEPKVCPPIPEKDNSFFYLSGGLAIICVILIIVLILNSNK
jgi:hypothetical protein